MPWAPTLGGRQNEPGNNLCGLQGAVREKKKYFVSLSYVCMCVCVCVRIYVLT